MQRLIGIDEVGRGAWAGPLLVVAARSKGKIPGTINDSKLLSANQRKALMEDIQNNCDIGEGWVQAEEIDSLGLAGAMRLGVKRALNNIEALASDPIIMDGSVNYVPQRYTNVQTIIRADGSVAEVSAASVFAKVTRDLFMKQLSSKHPEYKFESNVGYGTKKHTLALARHGITKWHRKSFKPVQNIELRSHE